MTTDKKWANTQWRLCLHPEMSNYSYAIPWLLRDEAGRSFDDACKARSQAQLDNLYRKETWDFYQNYIRNKYRLFRLEDDQWKAIRDLVNLDDYWYGLMNIAPKAEQYIRNCFEFRMREWIDQCNDENNEMARIGKVRDICIVFIIPELAGIVCEYICTPCSHHPLDMDRTELVKVRDKKLAWM